MTLGRYVDYTVSKQQPADWVSILPYITSLHSSLCFFFIGLIFPNHFPLLRFPGRGSRLCKQVMWSNMMMGRHNNAREENLKLKKKSSCCCCVITGQSVNLCANVGINSFVVTLAKRKYLHTACVRDGFSSETVF